MPERVLVELLHGKGAHADPIACVEDLSADLASRQMTGFPHSIGQLVFHMNYWMEYELCRIRGERPKYPEHASESFPPAPSPSDTTDWRRMVNHLSSLIGEFVKLAQSSPEEQQRQIKSAHAGDAKVAGSLEAVLCQMVAHNSYHAGQIALIRRTLGTWPPRAGEETW
jgi:uncharacterized damage-inducible protein DinB